jgi:hypothetical protein
MAVQVCSASANVTLNHGTFPGAEQALVFSAMVPLGAEVQYPFPTPADTLVAFGRLAS